MKPEKTIKLKVAFHRPILIHHTLVATESIIYWIKRPILLLGTWIPMFFFFLSLFLSYFVFQNLNQIIENFSPRQAIIYLKPLTDSNDAEKLISELRVSVSNIGIVEYSTEEDVANEFIDYIYPRADNGNQSQAEIKDIFPSEIIPTYITLLFDSNAEIDIELLRNKITEYDFVQAFQYDGDWVLQVDNWSMALWWTIIFIIISLSILILSNFINLIRTEFLEHKERMKVFLLLGAFPFYVRLPICWRITWLIVFSYFSSVFISYYIIQWGHLFLFSAVSYDLYANSYIRTLSWLGGACAITSFSISSIISTFFYRRLPIS